MASSNRPRELSTRSVVLSLDNYTFLVDKYRLPGFRKVQLIGRCVYYDAPLGRVTALINNYHEVKQGCSNSSPTTVTVKTKQNTNCVLPLVRTGGKSKNRLLLDLIQPTSTLPLLILHVCCLSRKKL